MKKSAITLIHTSATLVPVFQELCRDMLPGVDVFNIVDDSLIRHVIRDGKLTEEVSERVKGQVALAAASGSDYILVTCSSIGRAVEAAAPETNVPVLRVDQPMADLAVQTGRRIGVVATLPTTLEPTSDLVRRRAAKAGKEIELKSVLCEGAFEALMTGNAQVHDDMVAEALRKLAKEVDVILLAQASMARVVSSLSPEEKIVPIVASPPEAIRYLATVLLLV